MNFSVDLDVFRGPLDLLLYLVRKHEVEIVDLPIAPITDQFLSHLAVLEELDVDAVGDFLDLASTLIEIKARLVLPRADEVVEELDDPRHELVQRLLEYKRYKDASSMLEERGREWQHRYSRMADDLPARRIEMADQPIRELELWDLVSAFGRIMRDTAATKPSSIVYDDTPIHVFMEQIHAKIAREGRIAFSTLLKADVHKSTLIGHFLAILELIRHNHVRSDQNELFGEIWVLPGVNFDGPLQETASDNYDHPSVQ